MIDYQTKPAGSAGGQGLYVAAVAYGTDFMVGDRVVGVNGVRVTTCAQIQTILSAFLPGDTVRVTVLREDEWADIAVTLTESDVRERAQEIVA